MWKKSAPEALRSARNALWIVGLLLALPLVYPFLAAALLARIAAALEPRLKRIPAGKLRQLGALLAVSLLTAALLFGLRLLCQALASALPPLFSAIQDGAVSALSTLTLTAPYAASVGSGLDLFARLLRSLSLFLAGAAVPDAAGAVLTLSCAVLLFFGRLRLPLHRFLPEPVVRIGSSARRALCQAIHRACREVLPQLALVYPLCCGLLWLLGVPQPATAALLLTTSELLPLLGIAWVLLPWALGALLLRAWISALGCAVLFAGVLFTRRLRNRKPPRLSPQRVLLALIAGSVGWRVGRLPGALLALAALRLLPPLFRAAKAAPARNAPADTSP